jgi:hypothetical protein
LHPNMPEEMKMMRDCLAVVGSQSGFIGSGEDLRFETYMAMREILASFTRKNLKVTAEASLTSDQYRELVVYASDLDSYHVPIHEQRARLYRNRQGLSWLLGLVGAYSIKNPVADRVLPVSKYNYALSGCDLSRRKDHTVITGKLHRPG